MQGATTNCTVKFIGAVSTDSKQINIRYRLLRRLTPSIQGEYLYCMACDV